MEKVSEKLKGLTTESRERLQQCENVIFREVATGNLRPSQVALLLAKRFTDTHVELYGYPTLCLMDLMLQKVLATRDNNSSASGGGSNHSPSSSETKKGGADASSAASTISHAVLRELWPMFTDTSHRLLEEYSTKIERKATREKGVRLVKRWKERYAHVLNFQSEIEVENLDQKVNLNTIKKEENNHSDAASLNSAWENVLCVMIDKMEGRVHPLPPSSGKGEVLNGPSSHTASTPVPTQSSRSSHSGALSGVHSQLITKAISRDPHSVVGSNSMGAASSENQPETDASTSGKVSSASLVDSVSFISYWRKSDVRRCRLLLQDCLRLLESLPLSRSRVYATLLLKENAHHLRPPSSSTFSSIRSTSAVGKEPQTAGSSASCIAFLLQLSNTLRKEANTTIVQENDSSSSPPPSTLEKETASTLSPQGRIKKGMEVLQQLPNKSNSSSTSSGTKPRREALSHLLETLQQEQKKRNEDNVTSELWNTPNMSSFSFSTGRVVRSARPLLNDIALRLPLSQRSMNTGGRGGKNNLQVGNSGHGVFLKTAPSRASLANAARGGKDGSLPSYYYPTASASVLSSPSGSTLFARPFRVPSAVLQASPNGRGTRITFPSVSDWMDTRDMGELAQYDHRVRNGNNVMESVSAGSDGWKRGGKRVRDEEED